MMSEIIKSSIPIAWLFLILSLLFWGCTGYDDSNNERYVFVQDTLQNGLILVKGVLINGKKVGLWNEYNSDGTLFTTACYHEGKLNGRFVSYREYGWIFTVGQYKNDLEEGEWITYNTFPKDILSRRNYSNGRKVGIWEDYDDQTGKLKLKVRYGPNEEEEILEDNRLPVPE